MNIRIEFPFSGVFEMEDPGTNSREVRSYFLQNYLANSGMELGHPVEHFIVIQFNAEEDGEFWDVQVKN